MLRAPRLNVVTGKLLATGTLYLSYMYLVTILHVRCTCYLACTLCIIYKYLVHS